jgi:hypothetical protein
MKTFPRWFRTARILFTTGIIALACAALPSAGGAGGVPQPDKYAALIAKARAGTLQVNQGDAPPKPEFFLFRAFGAAPTPAPPPDVFTGAYRKTAKTSFSSATVQSISKLDTLFGPLPQDKAMAQQNPPLLTKDDTARIASEKRNVKVPVWIYWADSENDRDFHIILGSTAQLTSTTIFMNSEVSGLPPAHPKVSPFPQRRADIRKILKNHKNVNGLFVTPVAVSVTGSLLWDGEHRFPNNIGPEGLRPATAWEIHPIKLLAERQ